jgi:hypothetical protein
MSNTDDIVISALHRARDDALECAIELCRIIANDGGCAMCCADEITRLRDHMRARHLTDQALKRASENQN